MIDDRDSIKLKVIKIFCSIETKNMTQSYSKENKEAQSTQSNQDSLLNGNSANAVATDEKEPQGINLDISNFERGVILKQSPVWSRAMMWSLMGVTVFAIAWAYFAKIEQVVAARGQLKPKTTVKEIQAPINGVVREVEVKDGDRVKEGEPLLIFDSEATEAELESLEKIRSSLVQENKFYRTLINSELSPESVQQAILELKLPIEVQALTLNRASLVEENKLFKAQLTGDIGATGNFKPDQIDRLSAANAELKSRAMAAELEIRQLEKQLNQNAIRLADTKKQKQNQLNVLAQIEGRNLKYVTEAEKSVVDAQESLKIEREILESILPLSEEGALARIQIDRQKQEVQDRQVQLQDRQVQLSQTRVNGEIERENQLQQIQTTEAEIEQLQEEEDRLRLDINQSQQELQNTLSISEKDVRDRIAENQKRIAEIDSQINKIIIDNEKRIAENNSQISAAKQTIKYQALNAPVSGTVFDLQASPGFVPKSGQSEALMKIVPDPGPDNPLIAEVYVTNQDIGFVRNDQLVDVRIDSFPYSEFGDIKGKVYFVGSDALPPDQIYNFHRFPVKVELDQQTLKIRDENVELQSGMSVSVNIKVKENRSVLSLFTELFTKKVESLKQVR